MPKNLNSTINETGVLVRLSCSYPRYSGKVDMKVFGINAEAQKAKTRLSAIRKTFFSDAMKPLTRLEGKMRKLVLRLTFPLPGDFPFRFCPASQLPALVDEYEELETSFMEEAGSFITAFESHREESAKSWRELVGSQTDLDGKVKEKLIESLVKETLSQFPPALSQYSCDLAMVEISSPDSVSVANLERDEQKEVARAFKRIKPRIDRKVHELETNLISVCRNELYQRMFDFLSNLHDRLTDEEGGRVTMRTVNSVFRTVEEIGALNFMQDDSVDELLQAVKSICLRASDSDSGPITMNTDAATKRLKDGVAEVVGILDKTLDGKGSGDTLEAEEVPNILLDLHIDVVEAAGDDEPPPEEPDKASVVEDDFFLDL